MHNGVLGVNICHWQLHNGKQFRCCRVFFFLGPGFVGNDMHGADREAIIRTIRQFGIGVLSPGSAENGTCNQTTSLPGFSSLLTQYGVQV